MIDRIFLAFLNLINFVVVVFAAIFCPLMIHTGIIAVVHELWFPKAAHAPWWVNLLATPISLFLFAFAVWLKVQEKTPPPTEDRGRRGRTVLTAEEARERALRLIRGR